MSITRFVGIGAWAAAALLCAACGTTVETSGNTAGSGGSGGTVGPICPVVTSPCCGDPGAGECCGQCSTTGTSMGTGMGGFGGAGGSTPCGGLAGTPCAADEYCDFPDNRCGGNDGGGVCAKRPIGCPDVYFPTCGCDGMVHGNPCEAHSAGSDDNDGAVCTPPAGMFGCGAHFCALGMDYCELDGSDVGGEPSTFSCQPLPAACGTMPSCACLSGVPCGGLCMEGADGGIQIDCPGG